MTIGETYWGSEKTPTRWTVFRDTVARSAALAIAGGFVVGVFGFPLNGFLIGGLKWGEAGWLAYVGAIVGLLFGLLLGLVGGIVIGLLAGLALVPYRGARVTLWTCRLLALMVVAIFLSITLRWSGSGRPPEASEWWSIIVPSLAGAWFGGTWLANPYIRTMRMIERESCRRSGVEPGGG